MRNLIMVPLLAVKKKAQKSKVERLSNRRTGTLTDIKLKIPYGDVVYYITVLLGNSSAYS